MLGRAGRAYEPKKGHFHPGVDLVFARAGVRAVMYPPHGHLQSPIECLNQHVQSWVRAWQSPNKPTDTNGFPLYGPQSFKEAQTAVSDCIAEWRSSKPYPKHPTRTKENAVVYDGWRQRGQCREDILGITFLLGMPLAVY